MAGGTECTCYHAVSGTVDTLHVQHSYHTLTAVTVLMTAAPSVQQHDESSTHTSTQCMMAALMPALTAADDSSTVILCHTQCVTR